MFSGTKVGHGNKTRRNSRLCKKAASFFLDTGHFRRFLLRRRFNPRDARRLHSSIDVHAWDKKVENSIGTALENRIYTFRNKFLTARLDVFCNSQKVLGFCFGGSRRTQRSQTIRSV